MADVDIEELAYIVSLGNIDQILADLDRAENALDDTNTKFETFQQNLRMATMAIRGINAARLAVEQLSRGINRLDPKMFLYAILNMMQVLRNTIWLMEMLQKTAAGAAVATAILDVLTGQWWLIPLALTAAGIVYAAATRTMHAGGLVEDEGWYFLEKGELVVPKTQVTYSTTLNRFGPFTMVVNERPTRDPETMFREWGWDLAEKLRRSGAVA